MAEGGLTTTNFSLDQLESEITCAICHEHYTDPKVLPCLHYYCKQCIVQLAHAAGSGKPVSCPECRSKISLTKDSGVDGLKGAFFVSRFMSMFTALQLAHGKVQLKCQACSDGKPEFYCHQCARFICKVCADSHLRMKTLFLDHLVVPLQDFNAEEEASRDVSFIEASMKCHSHDEEMRIYCYDCCRLICRDCTIVDHKEHKFQFSRIAAPAMRKELAKELMPLREIGSTLTQGVEKLESSRCEIDAQGTSVIQAINASFDELLQIVEGRRQELLEETARIVEEKLDRLLVQESKLSMANAEVWSVVDYTERCMGHCSNNEIMGLHAEIKERIAQELKQYGTMEVNTEPVEEADVDVLIDCAEDLKALCQTKAKNTLLPLDLTNSVVQGEGTKIAVVDQLSCLTLTANRLVNNRLTKRAATVAGELRSLYDMSVVKCNVESLDAGEHLVQYSPIVRGKHELTLTVNGDQVAGSPFAVFVSIQPSQLGVPVRVFNDLQYLSEAVLNSLGEMIVAKQLGDVLVLYKNGRQLKRIGRETLQLESYKLMGLKCDSEDFLYLTLYDCNTLLKLDKEGKIVLQTKTKWASGHLGLAVVGEEVMVCPRPAKGTIVVYNKELLFVRLICGKNMGQFRDISSDCHDNLYATDWENKLIQVFDNRGVFLTRFSSENFQSLLGLCVFRQYVYVCNNGFQGDNHSVYVFTTDGDHVTTFGHKGCREGQFNAPCSVSVDDHGFLYVCDKKNSRVQVF